MNAKPGIDIVNVHAAKTNLSRLLDRAAAGEEIIIAKAGKPVARLVRFEEPGKPLPPRQPGRFKELAGIPDSVWFDPFYTEDELDRFENSDT